jgi:sirohydrochlorin cobaltochelatase
MPQPSRSSSSSRGLLIVDHGTRSAAANAPLVELAKKVGIARPDWIVEHAHMELAEPDFDTAIDRLVSRGASEILVHLHFLGVGYHVRESIPRLVAIARERHTTISIETTEPLSDDDRLVQIILDRMDVQSNPDRQSSKA